MANEEISTNNFIDDFFLISLVKNRTVLWDSTEENYRKKTPCDAAWEEVCKILFKDFELYNNDRKTSLTKDVKKKWTGLRDFYNKNRKAGKESLSKCKALDFLSKVYNGKERRSSLLTSPSKMVPDPDADTQVNSSLQKRDGAGTHAVIPFTEYVSELARPDDGVNPSNIMEESDSPSDSDDEDFKDVKPQCSTTFTGGEAAQRNVRSGVKRHLEENEEGDGDGHFVQFVKKSLIKNFNPSQTKRFRSEILQLLDSVSNDIDNAEMEDFNIETIKFLLSLKNFSNTNNEIYMKIMGCVEAAKQ